jgi:hypothetical protein
MNDFFTSSLPLGYLFALQSSDFQHQQNNFFTPGYLRFTFSLPIPTISLPLLYPRFSFSLPPGYLFFSFSLGCLLVRVILPLPFYFLFSTHGVKKRLT